MSTFHVFTDDHDWVVAESAKQARDHLIEEIGACDGEISPIDEWRMIPDDEELTFTYMDEPGQPKETMKASEWADASRPFTIASVEW